MQVWLNNKKPINITQRISKFKWKKPLWLSPLSMKKPLLTKFKNVFLIKILEETGRDGYPTQLVPVSLRPTASTLLTGHTSQAPPWRSEQGNNAHRLHHYLTMGSNRGNNWRPKTWKRRDDMIGTLGPREAAMKQTQTVREFARLTWKTAAAFTYTTTTN